MNTAIWVPDLLVKRVLENGQWLLFSPSDVQDLHDLYGREFDGVTPNMKRWLPQVACAQKIECRGVVAQDIIYAV